MTNNSSFFSDPKVLISILAILISIASFIFTLANQWEQNRRWDKLNIANLVIKKALLKRYKSITKTDAISTNWGYKPHIYGSEFDDQYVLPYKLVVLDKNTERLISTINACFTIEQVEQELKRINFNGKGIVLIHFEPKFEIENIGKTDAEKIDMTVDVKYNEIDWQRAFTSNAKIELSANQISTIELEMDYPISLEIPEEILFKIKLSYLDIHETKIEKEIITKWISKNNTWSYGNE